MLLFVNSCGRSGSTAIYKWVVRNAGLSTQYKFVQNMSEAKDASFVYKTHSYPANIDAKTIYVYGELKNVVPSIINYVRKNQNHKWLDAHLTHMFVAGEHKRKMLLLSRNGAWDKLAHYMIQNDKLMLKRHVEAWKAHDQRLLIKYEDLCSSYGDVKTQIENYLNIKLDDMQINKRSVDWNSCSPTIKKLLIETYE